MNQRYYQVDWDYSSLKYCPQHEYEAYERQRQEITPTSEEILACWVGPRDKEYYARKYWTVYCKRVRE